MSASFGKLTFVTARVRLSLRAKRTQTLARDSVAIDAHIHAKRTSTPPARAEGDFPHSAERGAPAVGVNVGLGLSPEQRLASRTPVSARDGGVDVHFARRRAWFTTESRARAQVQLPRSGNHARALTKPDFTTQAGFSPRKTPVALLKSGIIFWRLHKSVSQPFTPARRRKRT